MPVNQQERFWVLEQIFRNRTLLLSKFDDSDGINKQTQQQAWDDLYDLCKAKELPFTKNELHDSAYFKDQVFGRWRRDVLKKRDACKQTGSGSCPWAKWEVKLLEIIGDKNPILDGLGVPDSGEKKSQKCNLLKRPSTAEPIEHLPGTSNLFTRPASTGNLQVLKNGAHETVLVQPVEDGVTVGYDDIDDDDDRSVRSSGSSSVKEQNSKQAFVKEIPQPVNYSKEQNSGNGSKQKPSGRKRKRTDQEHQEAKEPEIQALQLEKLKLQNLNLRLDAQKKAVDIYTSCRDAQLPIPQEVLDVLHIDEDYFEAIAQLSQ